MDHGQPVDGLVDALIVDVGLVVGEVGGSEKSLKAKGRRNQMIYS